MKDILKRRIELNEIEKIENWIKPKVGSLKIK